MLNIDKVFVCHYSKLVERKKNIIDHLGKNNIFFEFVENEPSNEDYKKYFSFSIEEWYKKHVCLNYNNFHEPRMLKTSEASLAFKHLNIYKNICDNSYKQSIVFEDDVLLENNFCENFNYCLSRTPDDWDMIFIGNGCDLRIPFQDLQKGKIAYHKQHPASKCTDSYVIKLDAAKKILNSINNINLPIDFELNYQMYINNLKVYWWEPPLVKQGSQQGLYESEIQK